MGKNLYQIAGLTLESDLALPELVSSAPGRNAEIRFVFRRGELNSPPADWYHRWELPGGDDWLLIARGKAGYRLHFPGIAEFEVSPQRDVITCVAQRDIPEMTIRHLFLDQVFPALLANATTLVLHASAVQTRQGALVLLGVTGAGKSTLATALAGIGCPVITDDFLPVRQNADQFLCTPTYPGIRLHADSLLSIGASGGERVAHYTEKVRLGAGNGIRYAEQAVPLWRVCLLDKEVPPSGVEFEVEWLAPQRALISVISYSFLLDIEDREVLARQFALLGRLSASIAMYRVRVRRDYSVLPQVCAALTGELDVPAMASAITSAAES